MPIFWRIFGLWTDIFLVTETPQKSKRHPWNNISFRLHIRLFGLQIAINSFVIFLSLYTCQRIMRESHACGLQRSISSIKDNFSPRLTNSDELFLNTWLITKTKFNISENNPKSRLTLSQHTKMSSLKRSSDHLRTFSATFESLRKIVGNVRKFRTWPDENLTLLTQK